MAAHARAAVALADGDARAALVALRHAGAVWQELDAPYEAARARVLVGLACRALGDEEAAALELDAARGRVRAAAAPAPDLARVDALTPQRGRRAATHGLTARELQVLRLRRGRRDQQGDRRRPRPQRADRRPPREQHLQQARVSSRAAATAYAYEHELV